MPFPRRLSLSSPPHMHFKYLRCLYISRWFCEGRELHNSPDINISSESDGLQVLVIAEAFEDDTGRYTCTASNWLGSDTSSAEVFVEGNVLCPHKLIAVSWWALWMKTLCINSPNYIHFFYVNNNKASSKTQVQSLLCP